MNIGKDLLIYSPLFQFNILHIGNLAIINSGMFIAYFMLSCYALIEWNNKSLVIGTRADWIIDSIYEFVKTLIKDIVGISGSYLLPFVFTIFVFISGLNLLGIIPYTFAVTSQTIITLGLSISIWLAVLGMSIKNQGTYFLSNFMPYNSPLGLSVLLVNIELVSYIAKGISLGVRLSANITSGHILLGIIAGFVVSMLESCTILMFVLGLVVLGLLVVLTFLEVAVGLIQGFVFLLLVLIFVSDSNEIH